MNLNNYYIAESGAGCGTFDNAALIKIKHAIPAIEPNPAVFQTFRDKIEEIQETDGPVEEDETQPSRQREEFIRSDEHSGWCYFHITHSLIVA